MKKALLATIIGLSIIACPILYFTVGPKLEQNQIETLKILSVICGCSILYCFIVGELAKNNSQMDKLWSIIPLAYVWVIAAKSNFNFRIVLFAVIVSIWGIRLTYNFAKKGAYTLKFWSGEEDYRWKILRAKKEFQPHYKWMIFNLLFISFYQNVLVLLICLPSLVSMNSTAPFNVFDAVAIVLSLSFIIIETIADKQQWVFQSKKWKMIKEGKKLVELPMPYQLGFNTTGLWNRSRHPNYLGEQGTWLSLYIFSIAANVGIFNWSLIGGLLLIILFIGSSMFAEEVSASKYPKYKDYQKKVNKFIFGKAYNKE